MRGHRLPLRPYFPVTEQDNRLICFSTQEAIAGNVFHNTLEPSIAQHERDEQEWLANCKQCAATPKGVPDGCGVSEFFENAFRR